MEHTNKLISKSNVSEKYGEELWDIVFSNLKNIVKADQLDVWFSRVKFVKLDKGTITISVQNNFIREWIINNYFLIIKKEVYKIDQQINKLSIIVDEENNIDSSESANKNVFLVQDVFSKLNPKYIFENYVVGDANFLAYKICYDIASKSTSYKHSNIYYIHSHVGMGKTHLLQSISSHILNNNKKAKVGYLSAEKFMHNFVNAVKNNTLFELRSLINNIDIFLIDDIQFICGKESTQKEFSLILNSLIELGEIVIIASSIAPHLLELSNLKTKSLLISSNTIHIGNFDQPLRLKILEFYNSKNGVKFEKEILHLISEKVTTNVRELEASLNNLSTYLTVSSQEPSLDNILSYIQNYMKTSEKIVTIDYITKAVAKYYRLSKPDILSKKRNQKLVLARQIISYLAKELTSKSLKVIGNKLGDRDHSTVLYYLGKFNKKISNNPELKKEVQVIKNSLAV